MGLFDSSLLLLKESQYTQEMIFLAIKGFNPVENVTNFL